MNVYTSEFLPGFFTHGVYIVAFRILDNSQIESGNYGDREMLRKDWPENDPTLISEGLFAVANVFSFARIIYLFQVSVKIFKHFHGR